MNKKRKQRSDVDRRLRQASRHARTLRLLQLLLTRGRWNAKAIAAELECAERTVYRDLEVLSLAGVPWYFDDNERCYRVRPDFRFPPIGLTPDELLGQGIATALSQGAGLDISSGGAPTTRKLAASTTEENAKLLNDAEQLVSVLDLKLADHARSHETIRTVQWALLRRKQLAGVYASPYQATPLKLTLNPLRLCLVQQAWYLIARPTTEQSAKTYRVARFKSLRMLDSAATGGNDFSLKEYFGNAWAVYRGAESYDVAIQFTPEAAQLVMETVWHSTQTVRENKDGSVTLSFRVDGLDEIVWWVLGWSGRAKVQQPERLRQMVVEKLKAAIALHEA